MAATPRPPHEPDRAAGQPAFAAALAATLVGLAAVVVAPFLSPLAWALVLGQAAWPLHQRVLARLGGRRVLASLLSTGLVALALVLPLLWALALLQDDLLQVYRRGQDLLAGDTDGLFDLLGRLPAVGPALHDWLTAHGSHSGSVGAWLGDWLRQGSLQLLALLGGVGRNALKFAFTLLFLFFVFRDGEALLQQLRTVLAALTGRPAETYLRAAGDTSRAITLSVVLAAVLQGVCAAIGYTLAGLSAPVLLGFVTAVASVLPMLGTFLVWGSLGLWLLATGHGWQGALLLVWGTLLVHPVDNLLRPWLVSSAAKMPFLLALLGVLGGLASFGFVGVFLGPVILAVGLVLWNEWAQPSAAP
jgi:predicted PurR-regulated permease PerM